jgi:hypothetical protein
VNPQEEAEAVQVLILEALAATRELLDADEACARAGTELLRGKTDAAWMELARAQEVGRRAEARRRDAWEAVRKVWEAYVREETSG